MALEYPAYVAPAGTVANGDSVCWTGNALDLSGMDFGNVQNLAISKTANPAFTRTYTWTIAKAVDKTLVKQVGGSATFNYTVTVTETGFTDSAWQVGGTITVTNPNAFPVTGISITDTIDNSGVCSYTPPTMLAANASVDIPYSCTFTSIQAGETAALRDFFGDQHPAHIAEMVEDLEPGEGDTILGLLPTRLRAEVLSYLDTEPPGPDRRGDGPGRAPPRCST